MIKEQIEKLLEPYDAEIRQLINTVLDHEQRYISYELIKNSGKLKEVKQAIRAEIDTLSSKGYEA